MEKRRQQVTKGIIFLCLLLQSCAIDTDTDADLSRHKKTFGVFTVVNFPNLSCVSGTSDRNGTCFTTAECSAKGGKSSGSCASSFGVCCVFEKSCGSTVAENSTYFTNTDVPTATAGVATTCTLSVCKASSEVCQLRLDFQKFVLLAPVTDITTDTGFAVAPLADKAVNSVGNCEAEMFQVAGAPRVCGTLTGDHMYVPASPTCTGLTYLRASTTDTSKTAADFTIKVTQIECNSVTKAPVGCLQYYTGDTGTISTFNWNSGDGVQLADQDYSMCVRVNRGMCSICYSAAPTKDFDVGLPDKTAAKNLDTYCGDYTKVGAGDYLYIPGGACHPSGTTTVTNDRYCGTELICDKGPAGTVATEATKNTVCSMTKPFRISYHTDGYEDSSNAASEGKVAPVDVGFSLKYWLMDACLTKP